MRRYDVKPDGPERPSHFRETPEERTNYNQSDLDYATPEDDPDSPDDYGYQEVGEQAVGVYLTQPVPADRVYRDWAPGTYSVGATNSTQIGSANDRRRARLVVRNLDAANGVYLMRAQTDQNFTGFQIPAGEREEFLHVGPVWARSAHATDAVSISVYAEFEVDENDDDE